MTGDSDVYCRVDCRSSSDDYAWLPFSEEG